MKAERSVNASGFFVGKTLARVCAVQLAWMLIAVGGNSGTLAREGGEKSKATNAPEAKGSPWKTMSDEEIMKGFESPNAMVRLGAVFQFPMMSPENRKAAMPLFVNRLKDSDEVVRGTALAQVSDFGRDAKQAVPNLTAVMTDTNQPGYFRVMAVQALPRIEADAKLVVPVLTALLNLREHELQDFTDPRYKRGNKRLMKKTEKDDLRQAAAKALQAFSPESKAAVPALIEIVKGRNEPDGIRIAAIRALGSIKPGAQEAVPVLADALRSDSAEVRCVAAEALGYIGAEVQSTVPSLIAALKDQQTDVRRAAIHALGRIGPDAKAAIQPLKDTLTDKDVGLAAKDALRKIAPDTIKP